MYSVHLVNWYKLPPQADKRKACPQMGKNLSVRVNLKNLYQEQKRLINFLKLRNLRAKVFFNF